MTPAAKSPLLLAKRILRTLSQGDLAARRAGIGPAFRPVSIAKAESARCMMLVLVSERLLAVERLIPLDEVRGK